jgi:hypothetical protein
MKSETKPTPEQNTMTPTSSFILAIADLNEKEAMSIMRSASTLEELRDMIAAAQDMSEPEDPSLAEQGRAESVQHILEQLLEDAPTFPGDHDDEQNISMRFDGFISYDSTRWLMFDDLMIESRYDTDNDIMLVDHKHHGRCLVDISGDGAWRPIDIGTDPTGLEELCACQARVGIDIDDIECFELELDWANHFTVLHTLEDISAPPVVS